MLLIADPTALAAPGFPARRASSPYLKVEEDLARGRRGNQDSLFTYVTVSPNLTFSFRVSQTFCLNTSPAGSATVLQIGTSAPSAFEK